jgi:hypothetical protein
VAAITALVTLLWAGGGTIGAQQASSAESAVPDVYGTVFLTLPMAKGFADATHALVEGQELIRQSLATTDGVRLVGRLQEADVTLMVLGRGRGHVELTTALRLLDRDVIAPPVAIGETERYIEAMLTVAACGDALADAKQPAPSCYRRLFVGVGYSDRDGQRPAKKRAPNSWEACAEAVARDVRAWLVENAGRLRALRD